MTSIHFLMESQEKVLPCPGEAAQMALKSFALPINTPDFESFPCYLPPVEPSVIIKPLS